MATLTAGRRWRLIPGLGRPSASQLWRPAAGEWLRPADCAFWDALDGQLDWPAGNSGALTGLLPRSRKSPAKT